MPGAVNVAPDAAARIVAVLATHLVDEILRLLQLTTILVAKPVDVGAGLSAAALLPFPGAAGITGGLLSTLSGLPARRVLASHRVERLPGPVQLFFQFLCAGELTRQLARLRIGAAVRRSEPLGDLVERAGELLSRSRLRSRVVARTGVGRAASGARIGGRGAHRFRGLLHPLGKPLALEIFRGVARCRLRLGRIAPRRRPTA